VEERLDNEIEMVIVIIWMMLHGCVDDIVALLFRHLQLRADCDNRSNNNNRCRLGNGQETKKKVRPDCFCLSSS
jgi:hypothetical protein